MYIKRHIENVLNAPEFLRGVMAVTGARQTGKSTVVAHAFEHKNLNTVVLDELELRILAKTNPKVFLAKNATPLFIDEAQYAPELFPYMKAYVDKTKEKGVFFLSGSQRYNMMKDLSESLAGRVGIFELLGLSMREIHGESFCMPFVPTQDYLKARNEKDGQGGRIAPKQDYSEIWCLIHKGAFPELYATPELNWGAFYSSYINTYIERDVMKLENIGDEVKFYQFMQVAAANSG
ncbi:MAG: AAA family ATPase, partial [Gracilibacteraceae bacterium]|nr:AAA family ATPase [Gracilibacteraceae bacterium]